MRERTQVVACEGGVKVLDVAQHRRAEPLVVGIRIRFVREDRALVAVLLGDDDFVIPVRALDQSHRDRRPAAARQFQQSLDVLGRFLEIGLHDDADVGPVAELLVGDHALEQVIRDLVQRPLLHVYVEEDVLLPRPQE
jgi:hypothetical protein